MSEMFDCADETQRAAGIAAAVAAVLKGELVVLPTDTVYGVGADAFRPAAVQQPAGRQGPRQGDAAARAGRLGQGRQRAGGGPRARTART